MVPSFLARERTVAPAGYSRWLIPPAALAVHLCIGQVYATSVYKTALVAHFDSSLTAIGVIFSIAIVMLGLSAAVFGTWVDTNGPRAAMFVAAVFWPPASWSPRSASAPASSGSSTSATADRRHRPGHRLHLAGVDADQVVPGPAGLATGMAIMGFGGGALIASPLSGRLLASTTRRTTRPTRRRSPTVTP